MTASVTLNNESLKAHIADTTSSQTVLQNELVDKIAHVHLKLEQVDQSISALETGLDERKLLSCKAISKHIARISLAEHLPIKSI